MQMDSRVILGGQQPDIVNALARGQQAGLAARESNVNRQYGGAAMQGDQNALAKLASVNPLQAQGMAASQQNVQMDRERLDVIKAQAAEQTIEFARQLTREQALQAAAELKTQLEAGVVAYQQGKATGDWSVFNGWSESSGTGYTPEGFPMEAVLGGVELKTMLDAVADPATKWTVTGEYVFDADNPMAGARRIPGLPEEEIKPLSPQGQLSLDLRNGLITQEQFDAAGKPKGPLVDMSNANFGPQGAGVTDKFYEKLDGDQAAMFSSLLNGGMTAPSRLAQVDQLESTLASAPQGAEAAFKFIAGNFGIETEGLSELQAAQAIINRLVPAQRQPGSGPMSDADLALFIQSLPRLINTAGGNKQIMDTMRGLIVYEVKQAEIAQEVASRAITPAEGMKKLSQLENPLQVNIKPGEKVTIGGYSIEAIE